MLNDEERGPLIYKAVQEADEEGDIV